MRYLALVVDYDGTIAHHGKVSDATKEALKKLSQSGRKLILCTGREIRYLKPDFPEMEIFDVIVAENGGVLYHPKTREEKILAEPPPAEFIAALRPHGVEPLSVGKVIVATWEPHERAVLDEIHRLGLELHVIFNKGAVMVLPTGVTKASGLAAALRELHLSLHNTVGIGDAENDHEFLRCCEFSVAVQNALPSLKSRVDYVTDQDHGFGVEEVVRQLLKDDLRSLAVSDRHFIAIGKDERNNNVYVSPYGDSLLLAGASSSGKSRFMSGLLEKLIEKKYQPCIIDPEGDYEKFEGVLTLGDSRNVPSPEQVLRALRNSDEGVVVNLLGVKLEDRPGYLLQLLPRLQELRAHVGRPHWIVIDEAHHMLPEPEQKAAAVLPRFLENTIFITVHPTELSRSVLNAVRTVVTVGDRSQETMKEVFKLYGKKERVTLSTAKGEALIYQQNQALRKIKVDLPTGVHLRHRRKYSEGNLGHERSFYFRGPENKLNLRAQNLQIFLQMADGVDDGTWNFHLKRHDYSKWFREMIKDEELAREAEAVENALDLDALQARSGIRECVEKHYTAPAKANGG